MAQSPHLVAAANYLATQGYRVLSQSDQQVQLVKPLDKGCLLIGVLLLLGIWPGIVYLLYDKDKTLLLSDQGNAIQVFSGDSRVKTVRYETINEGKYAELNLGGRDILPWLFAFGILTLMIGCVIIFSMLKYPGPT